MANLLNSPAKINLGLRIVGRNVDNYHLIESVFLPLDFGDQIEIAPAETNSVRVEWAKDALIKTNLPNESENIATKLLQQLPNKWSVTITKNIPLGAGLGGGSSNAGTLLKYFVSQNILNKTEALRIAIKLGADVPYFIDPVPSWVSGIGEKCTTLNHEKKIWDDLSALLVLIPEHCDTKIVFSNYKKSESKFSLSTKPPTTEEQFNLYMQSAKNDLEKTVSKDFPLIEEVLLLLRGAFNTFCSLSGSGSTCFALYQSNEDCERKIKDLTNSLRKIGCKTVTAKILHVV